MRILCIVIDTSMSCSGELVQRFLEETYDVLSESDILFQKDTDSYFAV